MALVKCPDCGKAVSDKATSCNACGCPIGGSGSVGASAFEKRIKEYENEKYKVLKRSDNSVELMAYGAKHLPKGTTIFIYIGFIFALLFIMGGFSVLMNVSTIGGFIMILVGVLVIIPVRMKNTQDGKVIITLTRTGKISESGCVLKKK